MKFRKYIFFALLLVIIDQVIKLAVHQTMVLGETIHVVGDWAKLHYILNPGIAFGITPNFAYGKLLLSVLRMLAVFGLGGYVYYLYKKQAHKGLLATLSLIWAGALGNTIDSVFYGAFIDGNVVPGSPTAWFHGRVIDMFYFPMIDGTLPNWFPFWGGENFTFFSPIFNFADACISIGFFCLLIFQKRFFEEEGEGTDKKLENTEVNLNGPAALSSETAT